uniref:Protamine P1 family protein n=1 Tax=Davidia involucrata TaxID=16924 RepID=A0A5B6YSN0_DAVIN
MKVSSKPISSPSRTEKFPPPLMRFLKSNVGSRSRGRSRSSPMFMRKKNAVIETQEPSSPKVTCIGQVRVRRSSKQSGSKSGRPRTPAKQCHCWCVRKTLFCHHFAPKLKPRSFRPVWRKWVLFFRLGHCKKVDIREDFSTNGSNRKVKYRVTDTEDEDDEDEDEEAQVTEVTEVFNSSSPPKNALLLTRCRSAPYRSSSLANRFWGSPLVTSETGDAHEEKKGDREQERPESESEPDGKDSMPGSRIDRESEENSVEFEGSIDGSARENKIQGSSARPLILTRCKSEPARTGERLIPEASFWRHKRLGFAEPCSPHVCD